MTLHRLPTAKRTRTPNDTSVGKSLDCRMVVATVWDYLDGYCSDGLAERIDDHVCCCLPCLRSRRFQERFFAALAAIRKRPTAPSHLRERVRNALAVERRLGPQL